ncbi:hypothetical protein MHYP_G00285920 [Metynnis hypsauchen]
MGCGLRKIHQTEDSSPGKIYSTLKRPQVETKIGVAYTYCHLDFLVGKEETFPEACIPKTFAQPLWDTVGGYADGMAQRPSRHLPSICGIDAMSRCCTLLGYRN